MEVHIRLPKIQDKANIHKFFRAVIIDTFQKDGILHKRKDLEAEIVQRKSTYL